MNNYKIKRLKMLKKYYNNKMIRKKIYKIYNNKKS